VREKVAFLFLFMVILLFSNVGYSLESIDVEFLYYKPCSICPGAQKYYQVYLYNSGVVQRIERDYGEKVNVRWIEFFSEEGLKKVDEYNISLADWNTIVVNHEVVFLGGDQYVNETCLRQVINSFLGETPHAIHDVAVIGVFSTVNESLVGQMVDVNVVVQNKGNFTELFNVTLFANSIFIQQYFVDDLESNELRILTFQWNTTGFDEGNYTLSAKANPVPNETNIADNLFFDGIVKLRKEIVSPTNPFLSLNFLGILFLAFSFGFFETFSPCLIILLSFILGYTLGDEKSFKESFLKILVFGAGFVSASAILGMACAIFFFSVPSLQRLLTLMVCVFALIFGLNLLGILRVPIQIKPVVSKLARKYVFTFLGIFFLGFTFYFLDPCIAPVFVLMVSILFSDLFFLILLVFCLGAIIPFITIGFFAGFISKLTRSVYKYRRVIRGLSGMILIGYVIYLIFFYLL